MKMMSVRMQFLANGHSFMYMHSFGNHQGEKMLQLLLAECCFFVIIFIWCWAMAIWSSNLGVSAENGKMMVAGDESVV
jgi:hypothetical protein